jgi:hypothetical protein
VEEATANSHSSNWVNFKHEDFPTKSKILFYPIQSLDMFNTTQYNDQNISTQYNHVDRPST